MIIERELYGEVAPYIEKSEAIVITGMRRTGKTTLLDFIANRVGSNNTVSLDLENPADQQHFGEQDFERIRFNLETLGLDTGKQGYVFLDEIQQVKKLPQIVKYLSDHYPIKFFLTGSASFYLKNMFTESLVGRAFMFELYPLSFREYLMLRGERISVPDLKKTISAASHNTLSRHYREYLMWGGFPEVVASNSIDEKKRRLDGILSSYYRLEIQQLGNFYKNNEVRDLMLLMLKRVGSKIDIKKLSSEIGVTRPTVYRYIDFLRDTYFISTITPFSNSPDVSVRGAEKMYVIDSGIAAHAGLEGGALFEQGVFQMLRRRGAVQYYNNGRGREIDFILNGKTAFEAKLKADGRDVRNTKNLADKLKISDINVVSQEYADIPGVVAPFGL